MRQLLISFFLFLVIRSAGAIHADFNADKFSGCPPLIVNFSNSSLPNNVTVKWSFGNGNSSVLSNPSAIFQNSGTYSVQLLVNNGTESDSVTKIITVFSLPVANFYALDTIVCEKDTIKLFSDVIPGDGTITDYAWDLGNGVGKSGTVVNYVYSQSGTYDITLVVQDSNSCSANSTKPLYIQVAPKPHALFTANPATSCNYSQLVSFTNTSTGAGLSYLWKLDDSYTSTLTNPQYTYVQEIKNVLLTVTSSTGCIDSVKHKVTAVALVSDFQADKTEACTGEKINFTNTSNFIGSCIWYMGDGTVMNAASPSKVYNTPGVYTITMINVVSGICKDTVIKQHYIIVRQGVVPTFTANVPAAACNDSSTVTFTNTTAGTGLLFFWSFGDGDTSEASNPSHTYNRNGNFNVALVVTDSSGCSIPVSVPVSIKNQMPVARFRADTLGCPGGPVQFYNQSGGGSSYLWDFGDGTTSTAVNPKHSYTNDGLYSISLTVTSGFGCDTTASRANYVHIVSPVVDFAVNQTYSPCPPFVVVFHSTADRTGLKYLWDFGDGGQDTAKHPTHVYFTPGVYTVRLITKTASGCIDTVVYPNLIKVEGPTGTFTESASSGCLPATIDFSAAVSSNTATIWCDMGDGTLIYDSLHLSHIYTAQDSFNPKFILMDHLGCAIAYQLPPVVTHSNPTLSLSDTTVCYGSSLSIALGADNYEWTPPTYLSCHVCSYVQIAPDDSITYRVAASNMFGCSTIDTMQVRVEKLLHVIENPDTVTVCKGTAFTLNVGASDKMYWTPSTFLSDSLSAHPTCTPDSSMTYYITARSNRGCRKSTKIDVVVLDKLKLNGLADVAVCPGDSFQFSTAVLTAPQLATLTYQWIPANFLSAYDIPNPVGSLLPATTKYQVIASAGNCGSDTASVTVRLNPTPDIHLPENIITTANADVRLIATSRTNLSYQWLANDSFSCASCKSTSFYPTQSQTVFVKGTSPAGCEVMDSMHVEVVNCDPEMIFVANTFTPNGDGINDRFYLRSIALSDLNYLRVFDEWGRVVFETKNINEGWDGESKGAPAASAVYTYVMAGTCQNGYDVTKSGNIALMR